MARLAYYYRFDSDRRRRFATAKILIEGQGTKNLWMIATMMIVVALGLGLAEFVGSQRKEVKYFGLLDAFVVGFAQVLALIPGASRSGSTIMGGLFAGQKREAAARFSFLLMIPAITASGLLELREAFIYFPKDDFISLAVGTVVAGIVGYLSIWFLLSYSEKTFDRHFYYLPHRRRCYNPFITLAGILSPQV